MLRTIVAFANTSGGVVIIGVEDRTKKITGINDVLTEEERLANLIADSISPKLVSSLEVLPWRKTHVLAAEIHPSPNRPHYLARLGLEAGRDRLLRATGGTSSSMRKPMPVYFSLDRFNELRSITSPVPK